MGLFINATNTPASYWSDSRLSSACRLRAVAEDNTVLDVDNTITAVLTAVLNAAVTCAGYVTVAVEATDTELAQALRNSWLTVIVSNDTTTARRLRKDGITVALDDIWDCFV